jgi:hypothetical protein
MRKILVVGGRAHFESWKRTRPQSYKARELINIRGIIDAVGRSANEGDMVILLPDADHFAVDSLRVRGFIVRTPPDETPAAG